MLVWVCLFVFCFVYLRQGVMIQFRLASNSQFFSLLVFLAGVQRMGHLNAICLSNVFSDGSLWLYVKKKERPGEIPPFPSHFEITPGQPCFIGFPTQLDYTEVNPQIILSHLFFSVHFPVGTYQTQVDTLTWQWLLVSMKSTKSTFISSLMN